MASDKRRAFLLYTDFKAMIDMLTDEEAGRLLKAIFNYEMDEDLPDLDQVTEMAFVMIRTHLERDREKYDDVCQKRSEAGKLGGRPRKDQKAKKPNAFFEKQMKANETKKSQEQEQIQEHKQEQIQKHKYGAYKNVLLTDQDLKKLQEAFPDWNDRIEEFSEGLELKGYKYKNHYLAIMKWAKNDSKKPQITAGESIEEQKQRRRYDEGI